jgi:ribosome-associated toxin RatA of RatAB toxin-antitoxin module
MLARHFYTSCFDRFDFNKEIFGVMPNVLPGVFLHLIIGMPIIEKSVLVPFSAEQMYTLVERVEDYPQFLPWCGGSSVQQRDEQGMEATIIIRFKGITQSFSTRNRHYPFERIDIQLKDGPFANLEGDWRFIALKENACKVAFRLEYNFSNIVLEKLIGPVFHYIASSFIESFTQRARALYG